MKYFRSRLQKNYTSWCLLLCLTLLVPAGLQAQNLASFLPEMSQSSGDPLWRAIKDRSAINEQLSNKKLELEVFNNRSQVVQKKIDRLNDSLKPLIRQQFRLENDWQLAKIPEEDGSVDQAKVEDFRQAVRDNQTEIAETRAEIATLETELNSKFDVEKKDKQRQLKQEIEVLEDELAQAQIRLRSALMGWGERLLLALGLVLFGMAIKWIFSKVLDRVDFHLPPRRQAFIKHLFNIGINVLIVILILLVFFSQFIRFLPYLAIFATVVTLALKDVILSVIAWIIIGTKDGYKVGHYLHVDNLWGTVMEINPFNTIIQQGGMSGVTARVLTFPNKKIFESFLENWSKWHEFVFLKWDFYLEQDSDFEKAEKILLEILAKHQNTFTEKLEKYRNRLLKAGANESDLEPQVFWEIRPQGVLLRGKLLVDFADFFAMRSQITRDFAAAVAKEKKITLRFVQNFQVK